MIKWWLLHGFCFKPFHFLLTIFILLNLQLFSFFYNFFFFLLNPFPCVEKHMG
ncbi:MAG: hypothetical protein AVDCRST_MAG96-1247 [uncultured Segetibacter sp.]|uniref:Uncharacterized protein n=1 Tax=uncultured Segetibacter sp. TaxID=481133 RepID=A0A6J4S081_9BACT|nr:MAG: hypothetical protein AVDCRST_MAG96-1247 [uncultured Segetibacter sp.]